MKMKKLFALKKNGLIVAQILFTFMNYLLWAVVLKPLGAVETVSSVVNTVAKLDKGKAPEQVQVTAAAMTGMYGLAKTLVYLGTTGVFILLLSGKGAYKVNSNGKIVLGLTCVALAVDFINMTIFPSFPLYMLATIMLFMSKDVEEAQIIDLKQAA
jgi:hypothetical protein